VFPYVFFFLMQIVDPHTVSVNGNLYAAKHILVGVGGRPSMPDIPWYRACYTFICRTRFAFKTRENCNSGRWVYCFGVCCHFQWLKSEVHVFIQQQEVLRGFYEDVSIYLEEQR